MSAHEETGPAPDDETLGRLNFEAYVASKQGTTYDNKPIPAWADVGPAVQAGWIAGALAVKREVLRPLEARVLAAVLKDR